MLGNTISEKIETYEIVDIELTLFLTTAEQDQDKEYEVLKINNSGASSVGTSRDLETAYKIFDKEVRNLKKSFRERVKEKLEISNKDIE